jgi:2,4-dienoyl-CoA reductase-like NADH-dependent reductase (Old Yellow Enzyme family)
MFLQLWHQGAVDTESGWGRQDFVALSPSGFAQPGEPFGRAATRAELDSIKAAFVQGTISTPARSAPTASICTRVTASCSTSSCSRKPTGGATPTGGLAITDRATFPAEVAQTVRAVTWPDFVMGRRLPRVDAPVLDA